MPVPRPLLEEGCHISITNRACCLFLLFAVAVGSALAAWAARIGGVGLAGGLPFLCGRPVLGGFVLGLLLSLLLPPLLLLLR